MQQATTTVKASGRRYFDLPANIGKSVLIYYGEGNPPSLADIQLTGVLKELYSIELYVRQSGGSEFLYKQDGNTRIEYNDTAKYVRITDRNVSIGTLRVYFQDQVQGGGGYHRHEQPTGSDEWTISHNLGKTPVVQLFDSNNQEIKFWGRENITPNKLKIIFGMPHSGYAISVA